MVLSGPKIFDYKIKNTLIYYKINKWKKMGFLCFQVINQAFLNRIYSFLKEYRNIYSNFLYFSIKDNNVFLFIKITSQKNKKFNENLKKIKNFLDDTIDGNYYHLVRNLALKSHFFFFLQDYPKSYDYIIHLNRKPKYCAIINHDSKKIIYYFQIKFKIQNFKFFFTFKTFLESFHCDSFLLAIYLPKKNSFMISIFIISSDYDDKFKISNYLTKMDLYKKFKIKDCKFKQLQYFICKKFVSKTVSKNELFSLLGLNKESENLNIDGTKKKINDFIQVLINNKFEVNQVENNIFSFKGKNKNDFKYLYWINDSKIEKLYYFLRRKIITSPYIIVIFEDENLRANLKKITTLMDSKKIKFINSNEIKLFQKIITINPWI